MARNIVVMRSGSSARSVANRAKGFSMRGRDSAFSAGAKIRTGPPIEDVADLPSTLWGGVIPVVTALGSGVQDGYMPDDAVCPPSIRKAQSKFAG